MVLLGIGIGVLMDRIDQPPAPREAAHVPPPARQPAPPAPARRTAEVPKPATRLALPPPAPPPQPVPEPEATRRGEEAAAARPGGVPYREGPAAAKAAAPPPVLQSDAPMPPAPAEPAPGHVAPGRGALPAWQRFATAAPPPDGRPRIALVLDDVGPNHKGALRSIALPAPVTLAFLPYANDVVPLTQAARRAGHELLVHLPMEPDNMKANDPGPEALLVGLDDAELLRRLRWNLDRFPGYVGANNHMGSRFTSETHPMQLVMGELKTRGLMFLDSRTTAESVGARVAKQLGVPETTRDVFLDNIDTAEKVTAQLHVLEEVARKHGRAVAIGHPHPGTLEALERWLPTVRAKGFTLVPLTAVVGREASAG